MHMGCVWALKHAFRGSREVVGSWGRGDEGGEVGRRKVSNVGRSLQPWASSGWRAGETSGRLRLLLEAAYLSIKLVTTTTSTTSRSEVPRWTGQGGGSRLPRRDGTLPELVHNAHSCGARGGQASQGSHKGVNDVDDDDALSWLHTQGGAMGRLDSALGLTMYEYPHHDGAQKDAGSRREHRCPSRKRERKSARETSYIGLGPCESLCIPPAVTISKAVAKWGIRQRGNCRCGVALLGPREVPSSYPLGDYLTCVELVRQEQSRWQREEAASSLLLFFSLNPTSSALAAALPPALPTALAAALLHILPLSHHPWPSVLSAADTALGTRAFNPLNSSASIAASRPSGCQGIRLGQIHRSKSYIEVGGNAQGCPARSS